MAGSAILDPDVLVDGLVPGVIDGLRGILHPEFGVRSYRVFTVKRTWSGKLAGEGNLTTEEIEIEPQPKVQVWRNDKELKLELAQCGLDELGEIKLTEVSLTYTWEELTGRPPDGDGPGANVEFFIKVTEAHGQLNKERFFQNTKPPFVDRIKDMGWVMWLRVVKVQP